MTKQSGPTKERELILDILMEILENGGYSHVVLKKALDKHQYLEKQNRARDLLLQVVMLRKWL